MCAIIGALLYEASVSQVASANVILENIFRHSFERGRDGRGFYVQELPYGRGGGMSREYKFVDRAESWDKDEFFSEDESLLAGTLVANFRAEPTTEFVQDKVHWDQQPYRCGQWTIVHNGTIANDKEFRTGDVSTDIDSAAIVELLGREQMIDRSPGEVATYFAQQIQKLKGSYAILALHDQHPGMIMVSCNYRPIWYAATSYGIFFASSRDYFPVSMGAQMVEPYTTWVFGPRMRTKLTVPTLHESFPDKRRALVVCSGGMDSVVAAKWAQHYGYDVELLHFRYGSRAEGPEFGAIVDIATSLGVNYNVVPMNIYDPTDSPLLRSDSKIAGGEAGAEFAHEWVPARNLVMLAIATAYAEAKGFETIVLGNNLEEAGAYPDNEPEFINRFNDLLPFAVGDGKKVRIIMPVGNMMKHEIVKLGHELGAPLHLTWSCYRAGEHHCGTCGPCYMRRTAFKINGLPEVISYEGE